MPQEITHATALRETRMGMKVSHWIWWEFPQLRGLGKSKRAHDYGIIDFDEAARYLAHPVLGPRLMEMCMALLLHPDKSAEAILGPVDAQKVRSMATLFSAVPGAPQVFDDILKVFFLGYGCQQTLDQIADDI